MSLMPTGAKDWGYLVTRVSPWRTAGRMKQDEDAGWKWAAQSGPGALERGVEGG